LRASRTTLVLNSGLNFLRFCFMLTAGFKGFSQFNQLSYFWGAFQGLLCKRENFVFDGFNIGCPLVSSPGFEDGDLF
ncbi:hypothetical protein, partial [Chlorobium phaeovibrioides]|uniref:hypothetical protein n=1 Tax=Chlorobium phaeovibrioides TaxID=1094 RepID=UPI001C8C7163